MEGGGGGRGGCGSLGCMEKEACERRAVSCDNLT